MFQLKLEKSSLTIKNISSASKFHDIGDECPYLPYCFSNKNSMRRLHYSQLLLKKNYTLMLLDKGRYIIYNQKNQAIIDNSILKLLNQFQMKEIRDNPKLIEILYRLEFLIDG